MKILVTLTAEEMHDAASGGVDRRISAIMDQRRGRRHESIPDARQQWWQTTIIGAIGEYAVARAFGRPWSPTVGRIDALDVGLWQVRSTESTQPKLRVRLHDNLDDLYILAQVHNNKVLIHGYLPGHDVRRQGVEEYENVWAVTPDLLHLITDLPEDIAWGDRVTVYKPKPVRID